MWLLLGDLEYMCSGRRSAFFFLSCSALVLLVARSIFPVSCLLATGRFAVPFSLLMRIYLYFMILLLLFRGYTAVHLGTQYCYA